MTKLEHGGSQAIFDLIYSGLDGRMRKGDTYGVWTFNEQLYAGVYPMQVWDAQKKLEHASSVGRFLRSRKYDKEGNVTNLVRQLEGVLRVAKDLNVFIVTDGNTLLNGTPFDAKVNANYRERAAQVQETKRPLVTTLTARNGQFTGACVTIAGEKILLAELPTEITEAELAAASRMPATNELATAAPKKPLGQVVEISDVEAEAGTERAKTNTAARPVESAKVAQRRPKGIVITHPPKVTNQVAEPVIGVTSPPPPAPTNVVTRSTNEPVAIAPASAVVTNEPATAVPEPLPAIVPAQIKASARATGETTQPARGMPNANLMVMLGGVFVGGSLVGAVIFARRIRRTKQPSFISQGMERE
jgi:hypothetical protein